MTLLANLDNGVKDAQLWLLLTSSAELREAGIDMNLLDAVPCQPSSALNVAKTGADSLPRIIVGRLKAVGESADEVQAKFFYLRRAIDFIRQMSEEDMAAIFDQLRPVVEDKSRDRFKNGYGVLTIEEMAELTNGTPEMVRERELAGELFAARAPGRSGGPLYPKFQSDERVDTSLLKEIIHKYREADISTTFLWSFLRTPQKIFEGWTAMEMMLGATPSAFDASTSEEMKDYLLDLVDEHISRVRY